MKRFYNNLVNKIGLEGAIKLSESLKVNSALRSLNLSGIFRLADRCCYDKVKKEKRKMETDARVVLG